jgi:hypothetical protein
MSLCLNIIVKNNHGLHHFLPSGLTSSKASKSVQYLDKMRLSILFSSLLAATIQAAVLADPPVKPAQGLAGSLTGILNSMGGDEVFGGIYTPLPLLPNR